MTFPVNTVNGKVCVEVSLGKKSRPLSIEAFVEMIPSITKAAAFIDISLINYEMSSKFCCYDR